MLEERVGLGASSEKELSFGARLRRLRQAPSLQEHAVDEARAVLGDAAFEEVRERGREMSFEQAVAYALSEAEAPERLRP